MKLLQSMSILLVAAVAALSAAQSAHARSYYFDGPDARSLRDVRTIWLDSNSCSAAISDELERHGFVQASSPSRADAVLVVDVFDRYSSRRDNSAQYRAKLHGEDDSVLFTASGTEVAHNQPQLCEDIGNTIANSLDEMA